MDHIPESELAIFAFDPAAVALERGLEIRRHTAGCAECRLTLDFFAVTDEDLGDADVWEPVSGSATLDALMEYAARIAREDLEAEELLKDFLAAPARTAWTDIRRRKRILTGGVVRRLNCAAHDVCASEPLDALTFADAAISVADALPDDTYPAGAIFELRGTAWKERANALIRLGELGEAHESLNRAERAYRKLTSNALGLSSVALVRAATFYRQQRLDEAAQAAERAEQGFAHLGDDERRMLAMHLRASIRYEALALGTAIELFRRVLEYGEAANDPVWIAKASYALANCELDRGNLGEASRLFHKARALLREGGPASDRVSTDWGIARVLLQAGKYADAISQLDGVIAEFERRGMVTDAALAGLDSADALLALGRTKEIATLASRLFRVFKERGMLTGALTALAYLKEAAASGMLTPAIIHAVRMFVRRVERDPELVFARPSSDSR